MPTVGRLYVWGGGACSPRVNAGWRIWSSGFETLLLHYLDISGVI
jgi:hypothetical protein